MKEFTSKLIKKIIITTVMSVPMLDAHSAIIDYGTYFSDTQSGLNWLDVTATVNRSYNDISSQFGSGGEFSGWRYASRNEFNDLLTTWTGVSLQSEGRTETTGTSPSVDGLVELFGSTLDSLWIERFGETWDSANGFDEGFGIDFTLGILSETVNLPENQRQVAAIWDNENNGRASDFFNSEHRQVFLTEPRSDIGSFLVQGQSSSSPSAVPEPQTILIFGLGLLGLTLTRNRKRLALVSS